MDVFENATNISYAQRFSNFKPHLSSLRVLWNKDSAFGDLGQSLKLYMSDKLLGNAAGFQSILCKDPAHQFCSDCPECYVEKEISEAKF